ncbi:MAG TPA: sigma-70 family RNA polymerase sigma factor [Candidatus Limnocylindrales bacterium]|nr:sigma-70 family RNA polymerase sigma factor [Candidatus Limnocylindrales bacterium]
MRGGIDGRSDAELVARVVAGDEAALGELYDRYADGVYRVAFRLLGDRGQAEEVMQETILALWNRAELFDANVASLAAWLMTIARNRAVDRLRARARRPPALPLSLYLDGDRPDPGAVERALADRPLLGAGTAPPDPQDSVDAGWLREVVRDALAAMPDQERQAIELAYYEELSQTEIAARLGWPLGTVKTRTRRALARLREALAESVGPELGLQLAPVPASAAVLAGSRGTLSAQAEDRPGGLDGSR